MGKITIVRHGQDEDNKAGILNGRRDNPLTELGVKQATIVGEKLKDNCIDIIYCSPLIRARQTAQIIASLLGIDEIINHPLLIERDFGVLTGKLVADIPSLAQQILKTDKVNYFLSAQGAESFPSLYERAKKVLEDLAGEYPDKNLLIVAHGDIGKMIRAAYHGWTWKEGLMTPYLDNTGVIELREKEDYVE